MRRKRFQSPGLPDTTCCKVQVGEGLISEVTSNLHFAPLKPNTSKIRISTDFATSSWKWLRRRPFGTSRNYKTKKHHSFQCKWSKSNARFEVQFHCSALSGGIWIISPPTRLRKIQVTCGGHKWIVFCQMAGAEVPEVQNIYTDSTTSGKPCSHVQSLSTRQWRDSEGEIILSRVCSCTSNVVCSLFANRSQRLNDFGRPHGEGIYHSCKTSSSIDSPFFFRIGSEDLNQATHAFCSAMSSVVLIASEAMF